MPDKKASQRQQRQKKNQETNFLVSKSERERAVSDALKPEAQTASIVSSEVDKIVNWINQEKEKLTQNPNHKAFLSLDFKYTDRVRRLVVDTVLRILGSRLLNEKEKFDFRRPASVGIQSSLKPNLYIYYEHKRPEGENFIQEKYILLISKEMNLPSTVTPERIEEVKIGEEISAEEKPPEILEEDVPKEKEEKEAPGIFETINKILLGEEEP